MHLPGIAHFRPSVSHLPFHAFSSSSRMKYAFATSYADQHIAVLGAAVMTRAFMPLKNPPKPPLRHIMPAAPNRPRALLTSASDEAPRVCNNVLITSRGVVAAAANPPARPPAVQCTAGSYPACLCRCKTFLRDSYAVNCNAVKGTVIVRVVG